MREAGRFTVDRFIYFYARPCSETYILKFAHARHCNARPILHLADEPSRRHRCVDYARLQRNANFWLKLSEASRETVVIGILFCEIWRPNLEAASHKTIILEVCSVKIVGSIVRNARFGSVLLSNLKVAPHETIILKIFFCENCRQHRTKCSFWKFGP